jgi:DNA gyrase/topoisomerase IV subunit A
VVGLFLGRRSTRMASTALSKQRQASLAKMKAAEAGDTVEALQQEIKQLEEELQAQASTVRSRWEEALQKAEQVPVAPRRTDIEVDLFGLAWAPHWQVTYQDQGGTTRTTLVPSY